MQSIKIKVTNNRGPIKLANASFAYVAAPASNPVVITTTAISDLSLYSNTEAMLSNVATAYTNAVTYTDSRLTAYTNTAALQLSTLNDVVANAVSNNATLVYNTNTNKYVVKQLDIDGGNF
jgi:hypothetical protein